MHAFEYCVPTNIVFGKDSVSRVAEQIRRCGASRVLVVYGGQSAKKSGLLDRVCKLLTDDGIYYETLGGVHPNPRLGLARQGVKQAIDMNAELILAVGGGSVIDTAKGISIGKANPDTDIWDFWTGKKVLVHTIPVGVILTIPAAGSETSNSAVLTDEVKLEKRGLNVEPNRPAFAIMDPTLAATLPKWQVACGVGDIMMHTLERYFNPVDGNETTMQLAEAVLRVTIANGPGAYENPGNYDAMSEVMWCGSLSHNGLTGLGGSKKGFVVHPMGHSLSEKFDITHGASLTALWPSWARYVYKAKPELFARYAKNVWGIDEPDTEKAALAGIDATEQYFRSLNLPVSLGELSCGVQDEAGIEDLAARTSFHGTRSVGSLVSLDHAMLREVFSMANH